MSDAQDPGQSTLEQVYLALTSEDDGRACKDIPEESCAEQPGNFARHVVSLAATKTGGGLADPKLVLSWLLTNLGAPAGLVGLLVPVREAGALLPQLLIGQWVRSRPVRKWIWAAGSLVQGLCVLGMAGAVRTLEGRDAGLAVVGLLTVFSLARAFCSVSYKDVLGKTVSKSTRGTATGTAGSLSSALVLAFGIALSVGLWPLSVEGIALALALAGALWLVAALLFTNLAEQPGATEGGGDPAALVRQQFGLLREDPQLVRFIATRGLLVSTALAPPYLLALGGGAGAGQELGSLGPFVLASSAAGLLSNYVWGRLADRSSRRVLIASGLVASLPLALAGILALMGREQGTPLLAAELFVLMVAYQGVRLGRSTHLVDMAPSDQRASYTALSNTAIGVLLLAGGAFGALAQSAGIGVTLLAFAILALLAVWTGTGLREVQREVPGYV